MKIIENISYGTDKNNVLDIYLADKENAPVFLYFHGGGLGGGSYRGVDEVNAMKRLAEKGITTISAEYRMYPEAKYPQFIQDSADAAKWVLENISRYTTYSGIFIGGTSAGGYLSQMLCFDKKYFNERNIAVDDIAGFIHDCGQPTTHFNVLRERGFGTDEENLTRRVMVDEAAPMYHIDGTQKYPPMLFIASDNDMPNRLEQTVLMVSILKNYGYDMSKIKLSVMENSTHASYLWTNDDKGENLFVKEVVKFIESMTN